MVIGDLSMVTKAKSATTKKVVKKEVKVEEKPKRKSVDNADITLCNLVASGKSVQEARKILEG